MNKAWKFGKDVNTDDIIPARYLNTHDSKELAEHLMEYTGNNEFLNKRQPGDLIIAGKNFGCGSSREHTVYAMKGAGIEYVIAPSFARIFYRNSFNIGLMPIICKDYEKISQGDLIEVDPKNGIIKNYTKSEEYKFDPIPDFMQELVDSGGLMNYIKNSKKFI